MTDSSRDAFEEWFFGKAAPEKRNGDSYMLMSAYSAWSAWQAAVEWKEQSAKGRDIKENNG